MRDSSPKISASFFQFDIEEQSHIADLNSHLPSNIPRGQYRMKTCGEVLFWRELNGTLNSRRSKRVKPDTFRRANEIRHLNVSDLKVQSPGFRACDEMARSPLRDAQVSPLPIDGIPVRS
jgi:hypothetical protein